MTCTQIKHKQKDTSQWETRLNLKHRIVDMIKSEKDDIFLIGVQNNRNNSCAPSNKKKKNREREMELRNPKYYDFFQCS